MFLHPRVAYLSIGFMKPFMRREACPCMPNGQMRQAPLELKHDGTYRACPCSNLFTEDLNEITSYEFLCLQFKAFQEPQCKKKWPMTVPKFDIISQILDGNLQLRPLFRSLNHPRCSATDLQ
jgi:hypothetical protein